MVSEQTRERNRRATIASDVAAAHSGVMHRRDLARAGVDRFGVRTEVAAGRWVAAGRHTLVVGAPEPSGAGLWWRAVWESGSGSVLDGAGSDRQAALLVCPPVQQRLIAPARLMAAWRTVDRSPRRAMLDAVIGDVCDGAHSLGELDFGRWCQRYGLPQPRRQTMRVTERGRCYLDVEFDGLVVEIDGGHTLGSRPLLTHCGPTSSCSAPIGCFACRAWVALGAGCLHGPGCARSRAGCYAKRALWRTIGIAGQSRLADILDFWVCRVLWHNRSLRPMPHAPATGGVLLET